MFQREDILNIIFCIDFASILHRFGFRSLS